MDIAQIHYMIGVAFVEIRSAKELRTAQALADIFHNAPSMVMNSHSADEIYLSLRERASRLGMEGYLDALAAASARWRENGGGRPRA